MVGGHCPDADDPRRLRQTADRLLRVGRVGRLAPGGPGPVVVHHRGHQPLGRVGRVERRRGPERSRPGRGPGCPAGAAAGYRRSLNSESRVSHLAALRVSSRVVIAAGPWYWLTKYASQVVAMSSPGFVWPYRSFRANVHSAEVV